MGWREDIITFIRQPWGLISHNLGGIAALYSAVGMYVNAIVIKDRFTQTMCLAMEVNGCEVASPWKEGYPRTLGQTIRGPCRASIQYTEEPSSKEQIDRG